MQRRKEASGTQQQAKITSRKDVRMNGDRSPDVAARNRVVIDFLRGTSLETRATWRAA
jgi:hypothetical protein